MLLIAILLALLHRERTGDDDDADSLRRAGDQCDQGVQPGAGAAASGGTSAR